MADDSWQVPTKARLLNGPEWSLVTEIFQSTLPYRWRIFITNGLGGGGAPFTIPTSLLSTAALAALSLPVLVPGSTASTLIGGYLGSVVNAGYLMNVGSFYDQDMSGSSGGSTLLAHEMTHVWQGKNSTFALTYVISSAIHQCAGMLASHGSLEGRGAAYNFTAGKPWSDYNAEQQANIVETWFANGKPESGDLWPYIRDDIRQGKT